MHFINNTRTRHDGGLRRLTRASAAMALLLAIGSAGYFILGHLHAQGSVSPRLQHAWTPLECIYMTVVTVSTVGFAETLPVPEGDLDAFDDVRIYTTALVLLGMLLVGYAVSSATAFFIEGDLERYWWHRRSRRDAMKLNDHYIICGAGVTGQAILEELVASGEVVVAIDETDEPLIRHASRQAVVGIEGDATEDEVLCQAGIERAKGLAACLPEDKDNLYLMITARQLNPDLRIVTLASSESQRSKLLRAGADQVVSSANIGGLRIASELARPAVVSFLDLMLRGPSRGVRFAEVQVGAQWDGAPLSSLESELPILARQRSEDDIIYNPPQDCTLQTDDVLVTMGPVDQVEELSAKLGTRASHYLGAD